MAGRKQRLLSSVSVPWEEAQLLLTLLPLEAKILLLAVLLPLLLFLPPLLTRRTYPKAKPEESEPQEVGQASRIRIGHRRACRARMCHPHLLLLLLLRSRSNTRHP